MADRSINVADRGQWDMEGGAHLLTKTSVPCSSCKLPFNTNNNHKAQINTY